MTKVFAVMTDSHMFSLGPIQIMVVVLDQPRFDGRIIDQFTALEAAGVVTLLDAALVVRESEEDFTTTDIDVEAFAGRPLLGAMVGSLLGFGAAGEDGAEIGAEIGFDAGIDPVDSEDLMEFADILPIGGAAAVAVFEQTWARGLMGAIRESAGTIISDDIIHAEDLIEIGYDLDFLSE